MKAFVCHFVQMCGILDLWLWDGVVWFFCWLHRESLTCDGGWITVMESQRGDGAGGWRRGGGFLCGQLETGSDNTAAVTHL